MIENYCARVENEIVAEVIVCNNAGWASQNLGGNWICTGDWLVGVGWPVVNGEIVEPVPVQGEDDPE